VNRALIDDAPTGVRIILTGVARLEQSDNELLERVVGLEKAILARQRDVMARMPAAGPHDGGSG
jgi:hypothetical protein